MIDDARQARDARGLQPVGVGGILLCGGLSRRMGRPKEWLTVGSRTLLEHTLDTLRQIVQPIIVSARVRQTLPTLPPSVCVVYDRVEGRGPLEGISMGLAALQGRCQAAFVCACDQPLLSAEVIARLIARLGDAPAVVPEVDGRLQPLTAVYRLTTVDTVRRLLESGERRAAAFARQCEARVIPASELTDVDPDLKSFKNINDLPDYRGLSVGMTNSEL